MPLVRIANNVPRGPKGAQRGVICYTPSGDRCDILALTKMDILEKIFGSAAKVKIMRLFLFNPNKPFGLEQIVNRAKISPQAARLNLRLLESIRLIRPKAFLKEEKVQKNGGNGNKKGGKSKKTVIVKKRVRGWILNENFLYLQPLQSFLINVSPLQDRAIISKFNRMGKIKLLIVSGVFIQEKDSRVDILIVGDLLRRGAIDSTIKDIEAELGRDLTYSVFETKDFQYRLGMYDKLIRDILDYPHKKLVNRLSL